MKKIYIFLVSFFSIIGFAEMKYITKYDDTYSKEYTFDLKFSKYMKFEYNHFIFVKNKAQLKIYADNNSKTLKTLSVATKLPVYALVENKGVKWYEVLYQGNICYIRADKVLKRKFDWQRAIEKADSINEFFMEAFLTNKEIYYLNAYVTLSTETDGKKDKYGNPANQSIKAYYTEKEYINLPDRALFVIEKEDENNIYIKTLSYGKQIYRVNKSNQKKLRKSKINNLVNKFIYVDRKSQTMISIERNKETGIYNINTGSYVTTGINKGVGFVTPYGDYLVAYTKAVMKYTSDTEKEQILNEKGEVIGEKPIIVGEAERAIRFSGGAYLHGIPANYGTEEEVKESKRYTASKLGTYPLSHKCVRNADDVEEYLYKWVNGNKKMDKYGFTHPEETVIVMVE